MSTSPVKRLLSLQNPPCWYASDLPANSGTVTTRINTSLVGNPNKPSFICHYYWVRGKSTICPSISSLSNMVRKLTLAATNFPVLEHHQPTSCIWRFSLSAPPLHLKILQRRSRKVALKRTDHRQLHLANPPKKEDTRRCTFHTKKDDT